MKEVNVLDQITLAKTFSQARLSQINAISTAASEFQPDKQCPKSRICYHLPFYLCLLSQWLETHMRAWMQMSQLTYNGQAEHKIAHAMGVLEGVNSLGIIVMEVMNHGQIILNTGSLLALDGATRSNLKPFTKLLNDELSDNLQDASISVVKRVKRKCKETLNLADCYKELCSKRAEHVEVEVADIRASAHKDKVSDLLQRFAQLINEPFAGERVFTSDPGLLDKGNIDLIITRALASEIAADAIISYIEKNAEPA